MYTIAHAAELSRVGVATLRAWERRYGWPLPHRTDAGYRLYDEPTIEALRAARSLITSGWAAREAVEQAQHGATAAAGAGPSAGLAAATAASPAASDLLGDPETALARLRRAAEALDTPGVRQALDDGFSRGTFESAVDGWLMPALAAIGADWQSGRLSVAGEHLVANAVLRRLAVAYDAAARDTAGPEVVLGLPPGVTHELGILAFATCARRAGLATTYLGADVPAEDWVAALARRPTPYAVLAVPRMEDVAAATRVTAAVLAAHPAARFGVGGRFQDLVPAAQPLGHDIGPAADRLARALATAGAGIR